MLPKDRTVRAPLAMGDGANTLPLPGFLAPFVRKPVPQRRFSAETGLGALQARNRYGTTLSCIGNEDCTGVTPTPISPQDRAVLIQRGVTALPPGRPVFLKVPESVSPAP